MSTHWLADADPATAWVHHPWPAFAELAQAGATAILPLHGFADHGLGLPLDAEEIIASALLKAALQNATPALSWCVLPPLRFGLAPYPATFFGLDPETAHDQLREIAQSVRASGFAKLVFFVTSPWQLEFIDAASRDLRADLNLQTFVINLAGLGLDFHPASPRRAAVQAVAAHVLKTPPDTASRPSEVRHTDFRPGYYAQPAPLALDSTLNGATLFANAAARLARLLAEIAARRPLADDSSARKAPTASATADPTPPRDSASSDAPEGAEFFPGNFRDLYLPALTREALEALPEKQRALVIVPTGAIEQHGPHLPVGVDAILAQAGLSEALRKLTADARAHVWIAPPITFGKSNEHLGFPGTITLSAKTLRRLALALATQLRVLGFRRLAFFNTHGGNSAVLVYTLREIQNTLGLDAGMLRFGPTMKHLPAPNPLSPRENDFGFHGGEWETSLMLACAPELVRMERAVCEFPPASDTAGELRPENAPAIFSWITRDISQSGVLGDATRATAEKGQTWLDAAAQALAQRIVELLP